VSHGLSLTGQTAGVLALVLAGVLAIGFWRRLSAGHLLAVCLFAVYLVGVANFALLPLEFDPELARAVGPIDLGRLINLRPWFVGGTFMPADQAFLNVLLTVPFGFGLPFVARLGAPAVLVGGLLFSVGLELAQLAANAAHLALPTWSIDINDVLLNSLGVALGYGAFLAACAIYRAAAGRLNGLGRGPWAHFHDTLLNGRMPGKEA
jgi:glycopeptide antibiotics resistance protein